MGARRFLEEARILATLEGAPAVVRVYDFLEANGTADMIMGLVRGETLEERLKREKQLSPPIVERLFERLLDGLEEVHRAGFLHRDVKPANIVFDAQDNPTLIDFGASRASVPDRTAAMTAILRRGMPPRNSSRRIDRDRGRISTACRQRSIMRSQGRRPQLIGTRAQRYLSPFDRDPAGGLLASAAGSDRCRSGDRGEGSPPIDCDLARRGSL